MNADAARDQSKWTFLTNHLHALACLARDPELRIRDIANLIGITERATVQILSQLEASGYLTKTRVGRRNHYTIHGELPLRHPLNNGRQVGELLRVIEPEIPPPAARSRPHLAVPPPQSQAPTPTPDRASVPGQGGA